MEVRLRPFGPADLEALVAIRNEDEPQPVEAESFADGLRREAGQVLTVAEVEGRLAGYSRRVDAAIWGGWSNLLVKVAHEWRRRGIGDRLWRASRPALKGKLGAQAFVRESDPESRAWAERRGFALHALRYQSALELAGWSPPRVPAPDGYQVEPSEDWDRLYELYAELIQQTPDGASAPDREWFFKLFAGHAHAFVARSGEEWLGLSLLEPFAGDAYNAFTGVRPEQRGRGVAQNLKLAVTEHARRLGFARIVTNNLSTNAPMLAVNDRLGYVRQPGIWWLRRPNRRRRPKSA